MLLWAVSVYVYVNRMFLIKQMSNLKRVTIPYIQTDYKCVSYVVASHLHIRLFSLTFAFLQIFVLYISLEPMVTSLFQLLLFWFKLLASYSALSILQSNLYSTIRYFYKLDLVNPPLLKNLPCFLTIYKKRFRHPHMAFKISDNLLLIYLLSLNWFRDGGAHSQ